MSSALTHSNTLIIDSHCHFDLVIQALKELPETLLKKAQSHNINIIIKYFIINLKDVKV